MMWEIVVAVALIATVGLVGVSVRKEGTRLQKYEAMKRKYETDLLQQWNDVRAANERLSEEEREGQ